MDLDMCICIKNVYGAPVDSTLNACVYICYLYL